MYQHGHYGAALLAYAPVAFAVTAAGYRELALVGGGVAVAVAMVPDWDTRVPGVEHRGPTHTLWFALLVGLAVGGAGVAVGQVRGDGTALALGGFGFLVGTLTICSHVAADALTPMGVTPLTPFSGRHYSLGVVRASNRVANWLLLVVGAGVAAGTYGVALSL